MSNLVYRTKEIAVPESMVACGYASPAFVDVVRTGKHSYQLVPLIGITGNCEEIVERIITTQPSFLGSKDFAIKKAEKMLENVGNWPKY